MRKTANKRTKEFISNNQKNFDFLFHEKNKTNFINEILNQEKDNIFISRNYLLSILHQIGNFSKYKKKSHFLSSSSREDVAKEFSKDGLIIKFWEPDFHKNKCEGIYHFNSFVYAKQEEYSVFSAIFPHYILSFSYKDKEYFNPYIRTCNHIDYCIYYGFDINQKHFEEKLYSETRHSRGVKKDEEGNYKKI